MVDANGQSAVGNISIVEGLDSSMIGQGMLEQMNTSTIDMNQIDVSINIDENIDQG